MKRMLVAGLLLTWAGAGYANEEISVDLLGGATMQMVFIEPGTFLMGSPETVTIELEGELFEDVSLAGVGDEWPQHEVTISRGFYLSKYEITQAQWESVMGSNPSYWYRDEMYDWDWAPSSLQDYPVERISWENVQEFIGKLNAAAGEALYRLPTEAEWEYACRAGTTTPWSFGHEESRLGDYAWYGLDFLPPEEPLATTAVGTKLPNPWGLFDMHGNVLELVQDWHGEYQASPSTDPTGPALGDRRVARGGYFSSVAEATRSAYRDLPSDLPNPLVGARLLMQGPEVIDTPTSVTPESWGQIKDHSR